VPIDPEIPPSRNDSVAGSEQPPLPAAEPPLIGGPPPLLPYPPPLLLPKLERKSASLRHLLVIVLSVFLGLFVADAVLSVIDDSLSLFVNVHSLTAIRAIVALVDLAAGIVIYCLIGLTPLIPKRMFLPLTLFFLVAQLPVIPFLIYYPHQLQALAFALSLCQAILGIGILYWALGGVKFRWPLLSEAQLGNRGFSWWNISGFLFGNIVVLAPAVIVYLVVCAAFAVNQTTEGFLTVRPGGVTVQERKYVRNDGETVQLFPMIHIGDAEFYRKVSRSFPSNSVVLMEGVTDKRHLLTNGLSYRRVATKLGLHEQQKEFKPQEENIVWADVDVDKFSTNTINLLNLVMRFYSKGFTAETLLELLQYPQPPGFQDELMDDLLGKRNEHLLEKIHAELSPSKIVIVPWGAEHMPGIARELQKEGFHLDGTQDYLAIGFHGKSN
jgi:hypothetical protein